MTVYGTVRYRWFDGEHVASLTSEGWQVEPPDPGVPSARAILSAIADPREFGPADGDPMVAAIMKASKVLSGTYELATLPDQPPGTVY